MASPARRRPRSPSARSARTGAPTPQARGARSPGRRKCSEATIPPRGSATVAVSVCLCGSMPDHVARMIGRDQQVRRSRTALLGSPHLDQPPQRYVVGGPADNIPVGAPSRGERSLSSQADPRRHEPRPTLHAEDTPRRGVRSLWSQASVQPSTLREPSPARAPRFNTGIAFAAPEPRTRRRARLRNATHRGVTACCCFARMR